MSEQLTPRHESHEHDTKPENPEQQQRLREHHEKAATAAQKAQKPSLEQIRHSIEKTAKSKDNAPQGPHNTTKKELPFISSSSITKHSTRQMKRRIQKQLPARDRAFSKVIHQPTVEAVSDVAEKTIARPSGLLVAGLCSSIASLLLLYICRHYGYQYNFLIGLACMAAGFILGLILEMLYKAFTFRRRQHR